MATATQHPLTLRFTAADAERAYTEWGCNCGPSAPAAAMNMSLNQVLPYLGEFTAKRYMSPTMMNLALHELCVNWSSRQGAQWADHGLVRIQWGGPWLKPGVPIAARYRHTHWVATRCVNGAFYIFDINAMGMGGWICERDWRDGLAIWLITNGVPRGDGTWYPTHVLELKEVADE